MVDPLLRVDAGPKYRCAVVLTEILSARIGQIDGKPRPERLTIRLAALAVRLATWAKFERAA